MVSNFAAAQVVAIVASAALAALAAGLWMLAPAHPGRKMRNALGGLSFAHRGLYDNDGAAPENSLPAFEKAVREGYAIELDVRLTADGEVVVFHDGGLARMCGVGKPVAALALAELKALKLRGSEERIPLFSEVLGLVEGRAPLLVELKTGLPGVSRDEAFELCRKTAELLDGYEGYYFVESFDYLTLAWFREHRPEVMRGQLAMGMGCYVPALGKAGAAAIPVLRRRMLSSLLFNFRSRPHFIGYRFQDAGPALAACRRLGAMSAAWTVRTAEEAASVRKSFDAIIFEGFEA